MILLTKGLLEARRSTWIPTGGSKAADPLFSLAWASGLPLYRLKTITPFSLLLMVRHDYPTSQRAGSLKDWCRT